MPQIVYLISRDYSGYRIVYDTFSSYDLAKQCIEILEHNDKTNIGGWKIHWNFTQEAGKFIHQRNA